jgi:quercetin dioxygenase-like cupin family protein
MPDCTGLDLILHDATMKHIRWDEVEREQLNPLLERQYVSGDNITMARFLLRKGAVVPRHSHENEQLTYVIEGALKFITDEGEVVVRTGEVLCIPPKLAHHVETLEDTQVVDVFSPPRADWDARDDAYLRHR